MTRYKITAEMAIEFHDLLGPDLEVQGIRDRATLDYIVDRINGEEDVFRRAAWALYLADRHPLLGRPEEDCLLSRRHDLEGRRALHTRRSG